MNKQNAQMNAPYPGTHLPAGYPPEYPSAAYPGPPGSTGYPAPQLGYPAPQPDYPAPQADYPAPQPGYSVPPAGYSGGGPVGFPVQHQPMSYQSGGPAGVPWMPAPPPPSNCPPGLEYLSQIDQLLIHQQIELLEVLTGFETSNKYEIKNSLGQKIYFAAEDTDCCTRNFCGPSRPFTMRILDNMGREVITLERPLRCTSCCFPCCLQEIEVYAPPGVPIGYVNQTWDLCLPKFTVQNERREDVLKITGPCIVCSCCADVDFEIKSLDDKYVVGKISKQWTGLVRELFTDVDNFGIQFPLDLDVKMKAVMLGACFLIDFMFFENTRGEQRSGVW
ncbi:phospholipid scramblase 2 isoform X1 [Camelus dromedarius]|uniref:Phospholipid scramblase n=4 Tax=Camelus TaxID=9836 RepID=A0A8B8TK69_CAMFR|nr:phospholipid scramblase 2 isoform X1 [Camelus bactrianus]XP_010978878.1 phospholipid scramblase 2 isoform X1 [Camelus dromedarius]XP_031304656.1 phospholipid scramblase 2 isoform X1 [Camelus dromedarius]XP_032342647.1 phospholipid scramblase 2 isoform X1 [Camelus ferus]XP_032342655.1 phospholipid scramblase 2 isoform X1 [Camelus ferus]